MDGCIFLMSCDARPVLDELDLDVWEAIDVLDREILAVIHKLPFTDVIGEMLNGFDTQVGEAADNLDLDVGVVVDDFDLAGQADALIVAILIDGRSGKGLRHGHGEQYDNAKHPRQNIPNSHCKHLRIFVCSYYETIYFCSKKAQKSPCDKKTFFYVAVVNVVASLGAQPSCLSFFR